MTIARARIHHTKTDRVFLGIITVFLFIVFLVVAYPLYFVVISSISDPSSVSLGKVVWHPVDFSTIGYERVLSDQRIWTGYLNSIMYTVVGTLINLLFTLPAAYALSRPEMRGRNVIILIFTFTMFFSGGLIPTFLLMKSLGFLNTFWVMVLPGCVSVYNLIICRTFFAATIPNEMLEAAKLDGCTYLKFFIRIVLPLSNAIVAVMVLYYAVAHWNAYFNAMIYLSSESRYPLQLILRSILIGSQLSYEMNYNDDIMSQAYVIAESMKYAIIIVSSAPVLILYPFIQKYFAQGIMIGAIKG